MRRAAIRDGQCDFVRGVRAGMWAREMELCGRCDSPRFCIFNFSLSSDTHTTLSTRSRSAADSFSRGPTYTQLVATRIPGYPTCTSHSPSSWCHSDNQLTHLGASGSMNSSRRVSGDDVRPPKVSGCGCWAACGCSCAQQAGRVVSKRDDVHAERGARRIPGPCKP